MSASRHTWGPTWNIFCKLHQNLNLTCCHFCQQEEVFLCTVLVLQLESTRANSSDKGQISWTKDSAAGFTSALLRVGASSQCALLVAPCGRYNMNKVLLRDVEDDLPISWPHLEGFDVCCKLQQQPSRAPAALWWFRLSPGHKPKTHQYAVTHFMSQNKNCKCSLTGRRLRSPLTAWWLRWPVCCLRCPSPPSRLRSTVPGRSWCSFAAF